MKDTTVVMYVKQSDFKYFLEVFKIVSELPENYFDYTFRSEDIKYSNEKMMGDWIQLNIPVMTYLKWEVCYRTNLYRKNA